MHGVGKKSVKSGYILLYTLLIGILCITMAVCCFSYEMAVKKSNKYFNTSLNINIKRQEYKEHLFTYLNSYINKNIKDLSKEKIKTHFIENEGKIKFEYEKAYLVYDEESDCFVETYAREAKTLEKDYYSYNVESNTLILSYVYSEYTREGM